jgi:hypothetical protein
VSPWALRHRAILIIVSQLLGGFAVPERAQGLVFDTEHIFIDENAQQVARVLTTFAYLVDCLIVPLDRYTLRPIRHPTALKERNAIAQGAALGKRPRVILKP